MADEIKDELCSAKEYAEEYLTYKARDNGTWANRYKEMAQDELRHADYLHARAIEEIDELKEVYTPPEEMVEKWDKDHREYVETAAWVRQMLAM